MADFNVDWIRAADYAEWVPLFQGYADFYETAIDESIINTVWQWLLDEQHVLEGLLARDDSGAAVGIAHVRRCPRPLHGNEIGFLDDLFVAPEARGTGAADALFSALENHAKQKDWPAMRWTTQHFNQRGRAFYDRYTGGQSDFILYHWAM